MPQDRREAPLRRAFAGWAMDVRGTMSAVMVDEEGAVMTRGTSSRRSIGGVALLGALAVVAAAAALLAPAAVSAAPQPFPICIQIGGQAGPEIAGPMTVWTDNRNGNLDIYGKNLDTGRDYAVCTDEAQQDNPSVTRYAVSGKIHYVAVWVDKRNHPTGESSDIYGRDITTGERFKVAGGATIKWYPEIVDNWVIWIEADDAAGPYRVKVHDLATGTTYPTIATSSVLSTVGIDSRTVGGRTVYTAVYTSGKGNISGRNVPDGDPFVISQRNTFEWMPDISHQRVVWWESGGRIMMRDLRSHRRTFVHTGSRPRIDGELVTWDGGGHGGEFVISYVKGARVYVRNVVRASNVVTIAQKHLTCLFPSISGHRVVWESGPARRVLSHIHIYGARVR
jgi:beta propeller repeat protein